MLPFSKRDTQSVHLNKGGTNAAWVASVRGLRAGAAGDLMALHRDADYRELIVGDVFLVENAAGYIMQGRVTDVHTREIGSLDEGTVIVNYRIEIGKPLVAVVV